MDRIVGEILKRGGKNTRIAMGKMCESAWEEEKVPLDWMRGTIVPLYKDGDERDPMNYRGITLLSIAGKVFTRVLADRLMQHGEKEGGIAEEQEIVQQRKAEPTFMRSST